MSSPLSKRKWVKKKKHFLIGGKFTQKRLNAKKPTEQFHVIPFPQGKIEFYFNLSHNKYLQYRMV